MVLGFVQRYDFTGIDLSYGNLQNKDFIEAPIDNQPKSLKELMDARRAGGQDAARASSTIPTGPSSRC